MIRALLFDFDGLILDTEWPIYAAWQQVYRAHGVDLDLDDYARCVGSDHSHFDPFEHLEMRVGGAVDRDAIDAVRIPTIRSLVASQPILPGVVDRISEAQSMGLKLAVASSSSHKWVDGHLQRLGLFGHFDAVRCRDDVDRIKPAPDLYLAVSEAVEVDPAECLVFEDSAHGVAAARAAGMFAVVVPNAITRRMDLTAAHLRLHSLSQMTLRAMIDRLSRTLAV